MSNRLRSETSPYLLQHAENPVDWFPWGEEAFALARAKNRPIFLSVGYSACHWCHVMEHESFEDGATAALMNERFVAIKVDREERPDVDAIYMNAVQLLTGSGGWPMSVFLTPDAVPFYGGTYFPDTARYGMPSFTDVLIQISDLWSTRPDDVLGAAANLAEELRRQALSGLSATPGPLDAHTLDGALAGLTRSFDRTNGGWGSAPKFPQPAVLEFVLRRAVAANDPALLEMVTHALDAMLRGGIYDQLGGGFHRYATDEAWLVPHFEKMLYDNAQLARVYLHAWQVTQYDSYRRVVEETLAYVAREMLDSSGGFFSAQDADTEGEEGRFFVWTPEQIAAIAGADADLFMQAYGVTPDGNFEGKSILFVAHTAEDLAETTGLDIATIESRLATARSALFAAREARVKPGVDDKVLASWNGLMLAAFAEAARAFDSGDHLDIAKRNAEFALANLRDDRGRLLRTWKGGRASLNAYLEDYAALAEGLLELHGATGDQRYLDAAYELAETILEHFSDADGGFFDVSDDHEQLLFRPKNPQDGAMPSGGSMAATVLAELAHEASEPRYESAAVSAVAQLQRTMEAVPLGYAQWLSVLDRLVATA